MLKMLDMTWTRGLKKGESDDVEDHGRSYREINYQMWQ